MAVSLCRSCKAEVIWVRSPSGAWLILDAKPIPHLYEVTDGKVRALRQVFVSHFTTCPQANEWSKGKRTEVPNG